MRDSLDWRFIRGSLNDFITFAPFTDLGLLDVVTLGSNFDVSRLNSPIDGSQFRRNREFAAPRVSSHLMHLSRSLPFI